MQKKGPEASSESFSLRVKIGEYEVELTGTHAEVMATLENLPELVSKVNKAFEGVKPKTVATITLKTAEEIKKATKTMESPVQNYNYPKISSAENAEQTVLKILESDWGKWRPRTLEELKQAIQSNSLEYSDRALTGALDVISKKGLLRRWKTDTGFVYIMAEQKIVKSKGAK